MIKVKLVHPDAQIPQRANPTDAGLDLYSPITIVVPAKSNIFIDLGIQLELPSGTAGFIFARSGLGCKFGITPRNAVGVIDEGYKDNVGIMLKNDSSVPYVVTQGDRVAQLVVLPIIIDEIINVVDIGVDNNRLGGWGHSGK